MKTSTSGTADAKDCGQLQLYEVMFSGSRIKRVNHSTIKSAKPDMYPIMLCIFWLWSKQASPVCFHTGMLSFTSRTKANILLRLCTFFTACGILNNW
ncbi:hypothetical protein HMPREF9406_3443 [Clostridium sp. HGF2]|nr:hypothetical protein HMPREF9406_3443 [Clostridium sp. HGF2]EQJ51446.1 hypothetical protein QSI_4350 [Clostridioides difficile P28]